MRKDGLQGLLDRVHSKVRSSVLRTYMWVVELYFAFTSCSVTCRDCLLKEHSTASDMD